MTVSLDSSVAIDLLRGRKTEPRLRFQSVRTAGRPIVLSLVTWYELMFGVEFDTDPRNAELGLRTWALDLEVVPLSEADAEQAARVRAVLRRAGTPIGPYDVLIAGQALNRGWTLATSNIGEFARVKGLAIEDWSASR